MRPPHVSWRSFDVLSRTRCVCRAIAPLLLTALVGTIVHPTPGQATATTQTFNCVPIPDSSQFIQPWVVPSGVTEITAVLQGAHGNYPNDGAPSGFGGFTQGTLAVTPGQTLSVWVGCSGTVPVGFGFGGSKGVADSPSGGDGGFGGGGSAITDGPTALLVAGGGGGGGGAGFNFPGGSGGNGGIVPQPGEEGDLLGPDFRGAGGCANCQPVGESNGLDGGGASRSSGGGAGGGGGGGWIGGGGGGGGFGPLIGAGGGGGGGGSSYADPSATDLFFGTSSLPHDGIVEVTWGFESTPIPEPSAALLLATALTGLAFSGFRRNSDLSG